MDDQMALTRDEIIRMAQEAGVVTAKNSPGMAYYIFTDDQLMNYSESVSKESRNAGMKEAAEVCSEKRKEADIEYKKTSSTFYEGAVDCLDEAETAIRARIKEAE